MDQHYTLVANDLQQDDEAFWAYWTNYEPTFDVEDCKYGQANPLEDFLQSLQKDSTPAALDAPNRCSIGLGSAVIIRRPGRPPSPWYRQRKVGLRKVSRCIRLKRTVVALLDAAAHAERLGRPLNLFISVKPTEMDEMPAEDRPRYWQQLICAIGQPLRNAGLSVTHLWSRESCRLFNDGRSEHLHLLIHIPNRKMRRKIEAYLNTRFKQAGDVDIRPASTAAKRTSNGRYHCIVTYVLKNMSPSVARGTSMSYRPGGPILGKRCGCSRDIDSRAVAEWRARYRIAA